MSLVAISAIPAIIVVAVAINAINVVALSSYTNIRLYPLVLSAIKLKLTLPLSLSRGI